MEEREKRGGAGRRGAAGGGGGGGGGGCRAAAPLPKIEIKKKHRFCIHNYIKRFMWFTLKPNSASETADAEYIGIFDK
jgi:hypothetical protein